MDIGVISNRYAKALLVFTNESNTEEATYRNMQILKNSFLQVPELRHTVDNPLLTLEMKHEVICKAAGDDVTQEFSRFVKLVLKGRREKFLQFMVHAFIDMYRKQKNISVGRLTTAYPVKDEVVSRIRKLVVDETKGTVEFSTKTDPELVGGFIFDIGTYRLDASVARQMSKVKQQFIEKNKRIV